MLFPDSKSALFPHCRNPVVAVFYYLIDHTLVCGMLIKKFSFRYLSRFDYISKSILLIFHIPLLSLTQTSTAVIVISSDTRVLVLAYLNVPMTFMATLPL